MAALRFGGFGLSWKRSAVIAVVMNAVSTAGVVLIPALGFAWELLPGLVVNRVLALGRPNPITWTATLLTTARATTAIEAWVVSGGFKVALCRPGLGILLAQTASVSQLRLAAFAYITAKL